MQKTPSEDEKKHGDRFEPLIDRTMGGSSQGKPGHEADADDPAELQDDADEDVENDDPEDRRDVGERN
jgi:hypothetical protein